MVHRTGARPGKVRASGNLRYFFKICPLKLAVARARARGDAIVSRSRGGFERETAASASAVAALDGCVAEDVAPERDRSGGVELKAGERIGDVDGLDGGWESCRAVRLRDFFLGQGLGMGRRQR